MNKQLAKIGSTLNKNMTNTDALNLTGSSDYIESTALKCKKLHLPTAIPTTFIAGTM